jgi:MioC protein
MTTIPVLFGTESGNAELVADDITETLITAGLDAAAIGMEDFEISGLATTAAVILVTSTYGEGELPATTEPFRQALVAAAPDLTGVRFGAFGLGDSSYETYNNAITVLSGEFTTRGAEQIGVTGRHDAASGESFTDVANTWATELATHLDTIPQR